MLVDASVPVAYVVTTGDRAIPPAWQRWAAADNAIGAEHAAVEVGNVHRASFAAAQSGLFGEELLHHQGRVAALLEHDRLSEEAIVAASVGLKRDAPEQVTP